MGEDVKITLTGARKKLIQSSKLLREFKTSVEIVVVHVVAMARELELEEWT